MALCSFTGVERVIISSKDNKLFGRTGKVHRQLIRDDSAWIRFDEEIPDSMRSFAPPDDRRNDVVVFPEHCDVLEEAAMPYDGDGVYHQPPTPRSYMQRKRDEHERMGEALKEHAPMSERKENEEAERYARIAAMSDIAIRARTVACGWDAADLRSALLVATGRLIVPSRRVAEPANPCLDPTNSACACQHCEAVSEAECDQFSGTVDHVESLQDDHDYIKTI